jgi:predicted component of type VI protein secretion system
MSNAANPSPESKQAVEHITEARELLSQLRGKLDQHPELEEAITKLELALSALTLQTGGLL